MASLLLAIIYLAFISLGLPDSLLGSAWPEMYRVLGVELSAMGMEITVMSEIITAVSSSYIRNNFEKSRDLLPEKTYNYIFDRGIYCGGK